MPRIKGCRILIAITLLLCSASLASAQTINPLSDSTPGLSQNLAQAGTGQFTLTVRGTGFTSSSIVRLGSTDLATTFTSGDSTTLTAVVPASLVKSLGTLTVKVVDGQNESNSVNLQVVARADANANATVNIGDALVIARSVGGLVKPAVPATLGDVNLNDAINIGDALVVALFAGGVNTNLATPVITSFSPSSASPGDSINITGTGFSATAANNIAIFSKGDGTFASSEATAVGVKNDTTGERTITAAVPSGAASGPVFVKIKNLGLPSQPAVYTITGSAVPVYVTKVSKITGLVAGSTSITLTGSGFSTTLESNTVNFSAADNSTVTATPSAATSTSLTVTVPSGAVSGFVSATVGSQTSNKKSVLVSGTSTPLRVNNVYYGDSAGEPVLIEGTGFNQATTADNQVTFADSTGQDLPAAVIAAGRTELIALVPTGAVTGTVKVKTGSGSSQVTSNNFSYTASNTSGQQAAATTDTVDVIVTTPTSVALGAYQAVITFDPNVLFVDPLNVSGGTATGFTGTPTSVNVDNVGGTVTINHFQTAGAPTGELIVARIGFSAVAAGTSALGIDRANSVLTRTNGNDISVTANDIRLSKTSITVASNQIPSIISLSPSNVNKGAAGFTLTVNGQKFAKGAVVKMGATELSTTYINGRTLKATVLASQVADAGNKSITAVNPTPGGGASAAATFAVNNPVPSLTSISPAETTSGTAASSLTLTVTGKNFVNGSKVVVGGTEWPTTFVSETQLTATGPSGTTLTGGVLAVKARNSTPGGGDSSSVNLTVKGGAGLTADVLITSVAKALGGYQVTVGFDPKIVSIKSGDVVGGTTAGFAGTSSTPATVNIDNTAGSVIINDLQITSTPSGSKMKVATITFTPVSKGTSNLSLTTNNISDVSGADITSEASAALSVTSVQVPGAADPEIVKLDPATARAGGSAEVQVTIEGKNLTKDLGATFDGKSVGTVFTNDTTMTMTIPASLLKVPGTYTVNLVQGTTKTNDLAFVVSDPVESPSITSITPSSGTQGTTVEATIEGANLTGASEVTLNSNGLTTSVGAGGSSTKIPVSIKIDSTSETGGHTITVKATGGTTTSSTVVFTVNPAANKAALTVSPAVVSLEAGSTSSVITVSTGSAVSVDTTVAIESSNALIATAPAAVTIASGQSSTTFQVKGVGPGDTSMTLKAGGFASASLVVNVKAKETTDPIVESIDPGARAITGSSFTGTFTLTINGSKLKRASSTGGKIEFFVAGADGLVKDDTLTVALSSITETDADNNGDVEKITAVVSANAAKPGARIVVVTTPPLKQDLAGVIKILATGGTSTKKGTTANTLTLTGTDARPKITAVRPNTVVPGQSVDISIIGTNLGGANPVVRAFVLDSATQQAIVDQGLPVTVTTTSATAIVGRLVVNPNAEAAPRAIVIKTDDGVSDFALTAENRLEVTGSADRIPAITSVSPGSGNPNTSAIALVVKGTNLGSATDVKFLQGSTVDTKITASGISVNPAGTELTASVAITDATPGGRTVIVSTTSGTSSAAPSSANTFAVSGTGNVPAINVISPASGGPGQTVSIEIGGTNFGASGTVAFLRATLGGPVVATDVQVSGTVTVTGGTTATMNVAISASAQPGPLIVTYTAGGLTSSNSPAAGNTFSVVFGGSGQPTITNLSTKEIALGTTAATVDNFTVTGTNLANGTVSLLKFTSTGPVTDGKVTITPVSTSANSVVVNLSVAPDDDSGPRVVLVTVAGAGTTGGQPALNNIVQIVRGLVGARPHVDDVSPKTAFLGQAAFTITVTGTGFTGANALRFLVPSFGGPAQNRGITATNISVNSQGTQLTAQVTVDASALGGPNIVQVVVPAGTGTLTSEDFPASNILFVDINSTATEPRIERSEPGDAAPGQKFVLKLIGLNFTNITGVRALAFATGGPTADSSFTFGTPAVGDNGTTITVSAEIAGTAAVGPRIFQVFGSGTLISVGFPTPGNNFFVRPGAITGPTINFVQPPFVDAGASNVQFAINGNNLTGATASSISFKTISSAGSVGSAVTTITVSSNVTVDPIGSRIAGALSVDSGAAAGNYLVQVTINGQSTAATPAGGNVLTVGKAGGTLTPSVTGAIPRSFTPGARLTVNISGTNFGGAKGLRVLKLTPLGPFQDADIAVSDFAVAANSTTAASATLAIGPNAGPGPRVLQILGADANSQDAPAGGNVIDVISVFAGFGGALQNLPVITSISPTEGNIGQEITNFGVNGANLNGTNAIQFFAPPPFGGPPVQDPNIGVSNISVASGGNSVTATVKVNPGAFTGDHLVVVQTSAGPSPIFFDASRIFKVNRAATSGSVPVVSSVSPNGGRLNTTVNLTINGANFVSGKTKVVVLFPGPAGPQVDNAITVGSVTVNADGTQATTALTIGAAFPGPHLIVVSTDVGPSSDHPNPANLFAVESFSFGGGGPVFSPADITSVTPGTITAGSSDVTVTIKGTNLPSQGGVTFLTLGQFGPIPDPNITFSSISFSNTEIRVKISVAGGAASGPRAIVIQGPGGGSANVPTPFNTILVTGGSTTASSLPEIRNISPNSDSGATGTPKSLTVTLNGSNLGSVTSVAFLIPTPAGPQPDGALSISSLTTSSTSVSFTLTISNSAGNGMRFAVLKGSAGRSLDFPTPDNTFFVTQGGAGAGTGGFGLALPPRVTSVSASTSPINPGDTNITLTIAGQRIQNATDVILASPGPGGLIPDVYIRVKGFTVSGTESSATVTATIDVTASAPQGDRTVVVMTPFGPTQNAFESGNTLRIGTSTGGPVNFANLPFIDNISVQSAIQGQTLTGFKVTGRNLTGATAMAFAMPTPQGPAEDTSISASGISVNPTGTEVTANISVGAAAVTGPRFVLVRTSNGEAGNPPSPNSTINIGVIQSFGGPAPGGAGLATITAINPASHAADGATFSFLVTGTGLTGAGAMQFFQPTPTGPIPDPAITVTNFTVASGGTSATGTVKVPSTTASGSRFVVLPTPSGPAGLPPTKANTFEVTGGVSIAEGGTSPLVFSVAPQTVPAGSIVSDLVMSGQNLAGANKIEFFEFDPAGGIAAATDSNITVTANSIQVGAEGKSVRAGINIAGPAKPGPRIVVVTTAGGATPKVSAGNVLNVVGNSQGPTVEGISPNTGTPGQPLTLTINGRSLCTDVSCTASPEILFLRTADGGPVIDSAFSDKITITTKTPTSLTAIVNVPSTLTDPQFRVVAVRTAAGRSSDAPSPGNLLSFGARTNGPTITSITTTPDPLTPGDNRTIALGGTNLQGVAVNFFIPSSGGSAQKDQTLFAKVTASSSSSVTVSVNVPSNAGGSRLVIVSGPNGDNFGQDSPKFITITNSSAPTITSVDPKAKPAGGLAFVFRADGANLGSITGLKFIIPGLTPVEDTKMTATGITAAAAVVTANVTIATGAQPGSRQVLLFVGATPVLSEPKAETTFFVQSGSDATAPFLFGANPTFLLAGQQGQTLTLNGNNLSGAQVKFYNLPSGTSAATQDTSISATVDSSQSSSSTLTANVVVPTGASGTRIVVVETLSGNNLNQQPPIVINIGSLPTGGTAPHIDSISPSSGNPGSSVSITVNGANFIGLDRLFVFSQTPAGPQFDPTITVSSVTANSTQVTATLAITSSSPQGGRFIVVAKEGDSTKRSESFPNPGNTFFVGTPGGGTGGGGGNLPTINSVVPGSHAADNAEFQFFAGGSNLDTMNDIKFVVPAAGGPQTDSAFTVTSVQFDSAKKGLTATVKITTTAQTGDRVVVARNTSTSLSTPINTNPDFSNVFRVGTGAGSGATITSISPASHAPDGVAFSFTINGTGLDVVAKGQLITMGSNPQPNFQIQFSNVVVTATKITGQMTIPATSPTGLHHFVLLKSDNMPASTQPPTDGVNIIAIGAATAGTLALAKTNGDAQTGPAGQLLAIPLEVLVTSDGNPATGAGVSFAPTSGNGFVSPGFVQTDSAGKARSYATLGQSATGTKQTFSASAGGQTVTFTATVGTAFTGPIPTEMAPNSAIVGAQNIQMTIRGSNFNSVTRASMRFQDQPDNTITFTNFNNNQAGQVTVTMNISSSATAGDRVLALETSDGSTYVSGAVFKVNAATGTFVEKVEPNNGTVGQSITTFKVTGNNLTAVTGFKFIINSKADTAITAAIPSGGATSTQVTATLTIGSAAQVGFHNLVLVAGTTEIPANIGFQVNPAGSPAITSISPGSSGPGQSNVAFTVNGSNLNGVTAVKFKFGGVIAGEVTTGALTVSATSISTTLTILSSAKSGQYSIVLVPSSGQDFDTGFPFFVQGTGITGISPDKGTAGSPVSNFAITGNNLSGVTAVKFFIDGANDSAISTSTPTATSTQVTISTLTLLSGATPGGHNIVLVIGGADVQTGAIFQVNAAAGGPSVTGFTPDNGNVGQQNIALTITGSGFSSVTGIQFNSSPGVQDTKLSVSNFQKTDTQITATLNIATDASTGGRGLVLVTSSGGVGAGRSFQVNALSGGGTTFGLTVSKSGAGSVTSQPSGINCGTTCQFDFASNTSVTLTATAAQGSTFAGWSGAGCSGTGTCSVTMTETKSVTATFGGAATKLAFTAQPTNTAAGATIAQVQVTVQDANNQTVTSSIASITIALGTGSPSGATLSGTTTVSAVSGVASFNNLSINNAGTSYTLTATSGTLTQATSNAFNITSAGAGTATKLAFTAQPTNAAAGATIAQVQVTVQDANNQTVTSSTASITIALGTGSPSGATLSGTTTVSAVSGVASFNNLSINNAGTGYTLTATSSTLTQATSNAFNITSSGGQQTTPTVTGFSQLGGIQGQTSNANLTVTGSNLTGVTFRFIINGNNDTSITLGNISVDNAGTQATTTITVGSNAVAGEHFVRAVKDSQEFETPSTFIVYAPNSPAVFGISPDNGNQGGASPATTRVTITGASLSGVTGLSVVNQSTGTADPGITVQIVGTPSASSVTADLAIANNAQVGKHVIVLQAGANTFVSTNASFRVNTSTGLTVFSSNPQKATLGASSVSFTLTGSGLNTITGLQFLDISGANDTNITVGSFSANATSITAALGIGTTNVPIGPRPIALVPTTGSIPTTSALRITSSGGATVNTISPSFGQRPTTGTTTINFTIFGENLSGFDGVQFFASGANDPKVTATQVSASASQITGTVSIAADATPGGRGVVLMSGSTPTGTTLKFTVNQ